MKVTPELWIAREEAQRIGLSPNCGTNYTVLYGLARVRVEPVKIVS